ncbi:zinc finger protein 862-like [Ptychodera flava]|uniref:zinc finger protein 862-like n=1 Tax=Ptychodera flava TaxID=63121 RepID=UPI003969DF3B
MASKRTLTDFWGTPGPSRKETEQSKNGGDEKRESGAATEGRKLLTAKRKMKPDWFRRFLWLRHDGEKRMFFCNFCIKAGRTNIFTTGRQSDIPKADDFVKHERTGDHKFACSANCSVKNDEMPKAAATAYNAVREAIVATMRSVYFVAKEDMAKAKVKAVVDFCDLQGVKSFAALRQDDRVTYMHSTSTNDFIDCISEVIEKDVIGKMKSAKFYSLELDESTDVSVSQNLMIYIRGVVDGKIESHFLSVSPLSNATSEQLYLDVKDILKEKGLLLSNLISLGTDGASVMTGKRQGLTTRFKKDNPFILSQHCAAHKLALASGQAADCVPYLVKYQALVNDLYKYYHYSPKNQNKLATAQESVGDRKLKYQQVFHTRWLSFYNTVSTICKTFDSLLSALHDDVEHNQNNARVSGLLKNIARFDFIAMSYFLLDVLAVLNTTCLSLQADNLTFSDVSEYICACKRAIDDFKVKKGPHFLKFLESVESENADRAEFEFHSHKIALTSKHRENFAKSSQKFLDCLSDNLASRFDESDDVISASFDILVPSKSPADDGELLEYGIQEIDTLGDFFGTEKVTSEGNTVNPPLCKEKLINEWSVFKYVMWKHRNQNFCEFWEWVLRSHGQSYPNLCTLATICLTCPVTSVNVERGFSRYNIIKTALRNALHTENVNNLLVIKIEGPDIHLFNFDEAFQRWCVKKDRRAFKQTHIEKVKSCIDDSGEAELKYSQEDFDFVVKYVASKFIDNIDTTSGEKSVKPIPV